MPAELVGGIRGVRQLSWELVVGVHGLAGM